MKYIFKHCVSNNVIETTMDKRLLCEVKWLQNGKIIWVGSDSSYRRLANLK